MHNNKFEDIHVPLDKKSFDGCKLKYIRDNKLIIQCLVYLKNKLKINESNINQVNETEDRNYINSCISPWHAKKLKGLTYYRKPKGRIEKHGETFINYRMVGDEVWKFNSICSWCLGFNDCDLSILASCIKENQHLISPLMFFVFNNECYPFLLKVEKDNDKNRSLSLDGWDQKKYQNRLSFKIISLKTIKCITSFQISFRNGDVSSDRSGMGLKMRESAGKITHCLQRLQSCNEVSVEDVLVPMGVK